MIFANWIFSCSLPKYQLGFLVVETLCEWEPPNAEAKALSCTFPDGASPQLGGADVGHDSPGARPKHCVKIMPAF
jgi:hypothetical protein